jgi:transposase InsO family protein
LFVTVLGHDGYDDGRDLGSGYIGRVRTPREKRGRNLDDYERSGMIGAAFAALVDEFTKENLALEVDRRLESGDVNAVLDKAVAQYGAPEFIRSDNVPEFIAKKVRCWIQERGFQTAFIRPGAPWENPYIESFNSRRRHR